MLVDNLECAAFIKLKNLRCTSEWHLNLHAASIGQASDYGKVKWISSHRQARPQHLHNNLAHLGAD